jgi:very-short-patch-repair endonuclease
MFVDPATPRENVSSAERERISNLLGFAEEILSARSEVQMSMQSGLGVFHEKDFNDIPKLQLDCEDGAWLRITRHRESKPPEPPEHVSQFLKQKPSDPKKPPVLLPAISLEVSIDEASDLIEGNLLKVQDVHTIMEGEVEVENRVKIVLHAENLSEMRRDFETYVGRPWADWAHTEKPVRRAMSLYNDLFKIHSAIHTSEGTPPELVWGIGIGRWKHGTKRVDMPLIEQSLDIEVESEGAISIRPRSLSPHLSLKPYIELDIDGTPKLQRDLQEGLEQFLKGDIEFSPFNRMWEPLLDTAASKISSEGSHIDREALEAGETIEPITDRLRITSSWTIFGRPRSNEFRVQDIQKLRAAVQDANCAVPPPIRGFTSTPKEEEPSEVSAFGLDTAVLTGVAENKWEPSAGGDVGVASRQPPRSPDTRSGHASPRVHFFPLPFNEEQGKISDMIDDPALDVVCVSGPPGTGKSHSIANIISHQMAMGKRVLVTARTPEAISAVREKLPKSLQSLVIASVGTDRDSAQQLQDAVQELTKEVVNIDVGEAQALKAKLEQNIIDCDLEIEKADRELAYIARTNLTQMEWNSTNHSPMELVDILATQEAQHGWFTDRPTKQPPAQLQSTLDRLKLSLPELAPDIVYAGTDLPEAQDLPTATEIIKAHQAELDWHSRETFDASTAPSMAIDGPDTEDQARSILREIRDLHVTLCEASPRINALAIRILQRDPTFGKDSIAATRDYIASIKGLEEAKSVRYDLGECRPDDFKNAASRGAAGQKPVGFGVFNGTLKTAVSSVKIEDKVPENPSDWQRVIHAHRLFESKNEINDTLRPFVDAELFAPLPANPWDLADCLIQCKSELVESLCIAARVKPVVNAMMPLFPVGLDLDAMCKTLDCEPAIYALRANLPEKYETPSALAALRSASRERNLPILGAIGDLADALGKADTDPQDLVRARTEITKELARLSEVSERLKRLGGDFSTLIECEAADWADRLRQAPESAAELLSDTWREAWAWGCMKGRVDHIVSLGNGDEHRAHKMQTAKRRAKNLEKLIRIRTLLGLKQRMSKSVQQALESFTQAISKIGTGKGKKAPRFMKAAQDAARKASSAAPVWIMPEYKIAEQLPAKFGDFDLVVLDEASQSDITALAALARGKKILVVGDEEQVSPSVVGIATQKVNALRAQYLDGLPSADLIDENSSIFEVTKRMHPESHVMLREHFRCVAPIINFSAQYYNNALVPLRVPKASERFDPPLIDVYIPGAIRQGSTNADEAKWIVDEIARLIADPAHVERDIGVISLIGPHQAESIGRMLIEDPRIGPDKIAERRIIYGDARTMQGQERSIVFLSMIATPGQAHAQTGKADQQRFNVAMSRAKDRLYLVRSVELADLKASDIKSKVLMHFINPMPDGRVVSGGESVDLMDLCESGFEREVLKRLIDANYRVRPQVSAGRFSIDLVVEGAEDRRLAIELDGDAFHGPDVWDRDMTRQAALERAGWIFWRVFGSQWATNKDYWWKNLCDTLTRLGIEPIGAKAIDDRFTETILVDIASSWSYDHKDAPDDGIDDISDLKPAEQEAGADAESDDAPSEFPFVAGNIADDRQQEDSSHPPASDRQTSLRFDDDASPIHDKSGSVGDVITVAASISVGSTVRIEKLSKEGGKLEVTVVNQEKHDPDQGMIGVHTPLGQALLDGFPGEEIEYRTGAYIYEVRILDIL